jgi:CBS domain-containing protein
MKIEDVMTRNVITVGPDTPIYKAARLMVDHGVSGLPVVDDADRLVGIVSEGDLIVRQKAPERAPWWRLFFDDAERLAIEYQKRVGTTVADVMTREVISVSPDLPVGDAALIIDKHRVRRLPVVADDALVGIVSRGDLVKALAATPRAATRLSGDALADEMQRRIASEPWTSGHAVVVQARAGRLSLWGMVNSAAERAALETMARAIDGCDAVDNHLVVKSQLPYHYGV